MRHIAMFEQARAASDGSCLLNIPDIVENIDILSAMLGPQDTCYAMMDDPDAVERAVGMIDEIYFSYYDRFRELVVTEDNINSFTAFNVLGEGKTAKVQCDFCALMSPAQFRRFVVPSLTRQCAALDHSVYHLDGPDAIKHLDAMELRAAGAAMDLRRRPAGFRLPALVPDLRPRAEAGKALHLSISKEHTMNGPRLRYIGESLWRGRLVFPAACYERSRGGAVHHMPTPIGRRLMLM